MGIDLRNPGATLSYSYSGARVRTRVIYIENIRPEDIQWGVGGMPDQFELHPNPQEFTARARSFEAEPHGESGGSAVTVTYTTPEIRNRSTELPEPEPLTNHALLQQVGVREEIVEIPLAKRKETLNTDPATGLQVKGLAWGWEIKRIIEPRGIYRVRWKLVSPRASHFRAIMDQYNWIHQLPDGGDPEGLYRFVFADATVVSTTESEVSANWELDTGTRFLTANPQDPDDPRLPGDLPYRPLHTPAIGFSRDPYKTLDIEAPKDNNDPLNPKLPLLTQTLKYAVNPALFGRWAQLPQFPGFG